MLDAISIETAGNVPGRANGREGRTGAGAGEGVPTATSPGRALGACSLVRYAPACAAGALLST